MRLHRLTVTAFGPFPDTVSIDFDRLSDSGLFLVHGETGAGKTSVLDGVCFALYGRVPGYRDDAQTLHSHHAPRDRVPQVMLEASLSNRRLRITRSPKWLRPRRRGTGDPIEENAHVRLEQVHPDGSVEHLNTDHREVADLLSSELGLDMAQFCQVVMLPQGGFAEFLRASQDKREQLLKTLFGTKIFDRVVSWLTGHRTRLYQAERDAREKVRSSVDRIAEQAEAPAPTLPEDAVAAEDLLTWTRDQHAVTIAQVSALRAQRDLAETAERQAAAHLEAAERQTRRRRQYHAAQQQLEQLESDRPRLDRWRDERDRAYQAAPVIPVLDQAQRRRDDATAALTTATAALRAVPDSVGVQTDPTTVTPMIVEQFEHRRRALLLQATQAVEQEQDATRIGIQIDKLTDHLADLNTDIENAQLRCKELPEQQTEIRDQLADATTQAATLPAAKSALSNAKQLAAHIARRDQLTADLATAHEARRKAVDAAQQAADAYQAIREQRLAGMAAELSQGLRHGHPCPVCGSSHHPHPASTVAVVAADDEDAAAQQAEETRGKRQHAENTVTSLQATLTELEGLVGDATADTAAAEITAAQRHVRDAKAANRHAEKLTLNLESITTQLEEARIRSVELITERSTNEERVLGLQRRHTELSDAVTDVRGEDPTLRKRINRLTREIDALVKARGALSGWQQAHDEANRAQLDAEKTIDVSPFPDAQAARRAHLTEDGIHALNSKITEYEAQHQAATEQVNDPELVAATREPTLDIDQAHAVHKQALDQHRSLHTRHAQQDARAARLGTLLTELDQHIAAWRPASREYQTANRLAQLTSGTAGDTRLTLSTYVLISRFQHVIAAANTRLHRMTNNRYTLAYNSVVDTGRRRLRDGLGLTVHDTWTSQHRKPATLSGGETFQVSLALALGLRDVVTAESGGTHIDTLFIDEGFGTLDDDALDHVLTTLDSLRSVVERSRLSGHRDWLIDSSGA